MEYAIRHAGDAICTMYEIGAMVILSSGWGATSSNSKIVGQRQNSAFNGAG